MNKYPVTSLKEMMMEDFRGGTNTINVTAYAGDYDSLIEPEYCCMLNDTNEGEDKPNKDSKPLFGKDPNKVFGSKRSRRW